MKDFSAPYGKAVYFPLSLQESADQFGKRDAWEVLQYALKWTLEQDVRSELLNDALDYLENMGGPGKGDKRFPKRLKYRGPIGAVFEDAGCDGEDKEEFRTYIKNTAIKAVDGAKRMVGIGNP